MNNKDIFTISLQFILLVLVQVLVLNHINFMGFINPYLYILFILIYPIDGNRSLFIFLSFLLGLSIDLFNDSGGVHAAACVFAAYIRPLFLKFSFGLSYEYSIIKIAKTPLVERIVYISLMILAHHLVLFSLEIFNFSHILLLLKSTLFSGIFSLLLIFCSLLLFSRNS